MPVHNRLPVEEPNTNFDHKALSKLAEMFVGKHDEAAIIRTQFATVLKSVRQILILLTSIFGSAPALAQRIYGSYNGTMTGTAIDTYGYFGNAGANLIGDTFSINYNYDPSLFTPNPQIPCGNGYETAYYATTPGALVANITIGSKTQTITSNQLAGISICNPGDGSPQIELHPYSSSPGQPLADSPGALIQFGTTNPTIQNLGTPVLDGPTSINLGLAYDQWEGFGATTNPFSVSIISPFLLGSPSLADINLATLLPNIPNLSTAAATGLAADGASAAIVLVTTNTQSDVTLTTNNGTTLLPFGTAQTPYESTYLANAPNPGGSSSLPIPAAQLFQIGSLFYAAALVQTPPGNVAPSYTTPITLTAQQSGGEPQQVSLPLVPPPVLLIPGLWNTSDSLQTMASYLRSVPPWSTSKTFVNVDRYNGAAPFFSDDAVTAVDNGLSGANAAMIKAGLVGGRVDLVVHSMGGLVTRYFTTQPAYSATGNGVLQDRTLGKFHQVVSLDTPQAGSLLANWLLRNQARLYKSDARKFSQYIWHKAGCSDDNTIGDCLAKLHNPVEGGAVASLKPGNAKLANNTPPPLSIPNIIWRSVSAVRPDDGYGVGESALEFELQELVSATYISSENPPTITSVLKDDAQDDAIVTVRSQLRGAPDSSGMFVTLQSLSHSPVEHVPFLHKNEANVETDSLVESIVSCWLQNAGSTSCGQQGDQAEARLKANLITIGGNAAVDNNPDVLEKDSQLFVGGFNGQLGVPLGVIVHFNNPSGLRGLSISQHDSHSHVVTSTPSIGDAENGTMTASIIPAILGKTTFTFVAEFNDGITAVQNVPVDVTISEVTPLSLVTDANVQEYFSGEKRVRTLQPTLHLGLNAKTGYTLQSRVLFESMGGKEIDLSGGQLFYTVRSYDNNIPCVSVSEDGRVIPLHVGTAIIESRLGSVTDLLRVVVR